MPTTSVVIPVKNGARLLAQVLEAVTAEEPDEVLVVDSGSTDGSLDLAAAATVEVLAIPPADFAHGRTRNLAVARTTGDLICFLTQDAVPQPGWLAAYREVFAGSERIGAAYGPHVPWPDTSPMIARELSGFFAMMSDNGRPVVQRQGDRTFLSNVNACYRRECVEQIGFADIEYSEDQAFGIAMLEAGWAKAYVPAAAVLHAHDYPPVEFAKRYFDEARGLAETLGHRPPLAPRASARQVRRAVRADRRWMEAARYSAGQRARWTARSVLHHTARMAAEALGSRHDQLPAPLARRLSLEGRGGTAPEPQPARSVPRGEPVGAGGAARYHEVLDLHRGGGPTPLVEPLAGRAERDRLHLAFVVPPYSRGSGGHNTLFGVVRRLEDMGHTCTIWMHDPLGKIGGRYPGVLRQEIRAWFAPVRAPVFVGFDDWHGADVAVATGWETAHPTAALPGCAARAYFVQDHEPEFYATSAESVWAEETYRLGLFPICASTWLRDLIAQRYGAHGVAFRLGVDHTTYHPGLVERSDDTVIVYARNDTERRAVPLALLAVDELARRRPDVNVVLFGQRENPTTPFPYDMLGIASPGQLALAYGGATVGVCLSLTNYSLIPQEMMACGLPCVDVTGGSSEAVFGTDGPAELCAPDPLALADGMQALLEDPERWRRRSEAGLQFVADADWDTAATQVEAGLRQALRERETGIRA